MECRVKYDTYLIAEVTPHLWGRQVRADAAWAPHPIEGTLWRVQEAGGYYAVSVGVHVFEAQGDWRIEVAPW